MNILAIIVDHNTHIDSVDLSLAVSNSSLNGSVLTVIHVDNGSQMAHSITPEQAEANVRLLRYERNLGYAGAIGSVINQLATDGMYFDAYWFLNPDITIASDTFALLTNKLINTPDCGAVAPIVRYSRTGKVWCACCVLNPRIGIAYSVNWQSTEKLPLWSYTSGCCLMVRASAYHEVGGLPTRYFLYYEETEMCVKLQIKLWNIYIVPGAEIFHRLDSMKHGVPTKYFAFYFSRNNLYFWRNNFNVPTWIQFPRMLFAVVLNIIGPAFRAKSTREFLLCLWYCTCGIFDSFSFLRKERTFFQQRLFPE